MDWAESVNDNVQLNIVAGMRAGLVTSGAHFLKNLDTETKESLYRDPAVEICDDNLLAFKTVGVPITICGYYDGEHVINRTTAINIRGLLTGDQGGRLASNLVTVFKNQTKLGEYHLKKLRNFFIETNSEFRGWLTIEAVWDDNKFYYRKVRAGVIYDIAYAMAFLYGIPMDIIGSEQMFQADTIENFSASLRIYTYPYSEDDTALSLESWLPEGFSDHLHRGPGYILVNGAGNKINKAWVSLYEKIPEKLNKFGLCWRTDGLIESQKIFKQLVKEKLV